MWCSSPFEAMALKDSSNISACLVHNLVWIANLSSIKLEACLSTQEPCLMWSIAKWLGIKWNNKNSKEVWKISQFTHLPLYCRLLVEGNQGGIKMTKLNFFTVGGIYSASLCEKYVGKKIPPILEIWEKEKKHLWLPVQLASEYIANHPLCQRGAAGGVPREATGRSQLRSLVNEAEWSPALPLLYMESTPAGFCLFVSFTVPFWWVGYVVLFSNRFILKAHML